VIKGILDTSELDSFELKGETLLLLVIATT